MVVYAGDLEWEFMKAWMRGWEEELRQHLQQQKSAATVATQHEDIERKWMMGQGRRET